MTAAPPPNGHRDWPLPPSEHPAPPMLHEQSLVQQSLDLVRDTRSWVEVELERAKAIAAHDGAHIGKAVGLVIPTLMLASVALTVLTLAGGTLLGQALGWDPVVVQAIAGGVIALLALFAGAKARAQLSSLVLTGGHGSSK